MHNYGNVSIDIIYHMANACKSVQIPTEEQYCGDSFYEKYNIYSEIVYFFV